MLIVSKPVLCIEIYKHGTQPYRQCPFPIRVIFHPEGLDQLI